MRKPGPRTLAGASLTFLAVLIFRSEVVHLWWLWDDPFHLEYATEWSPADYFFNPDSARALPYKLFTPVLTLEYDLDHALFGFNAALFHLHHLLLTATAAVLLAAVLSRWFPSQLTWLISAAIFLGPGVSVWVQELMTRHYVTGLMFSCLSILSHRAATRHGSRLLRWLALLLFTAAALSKEIYVPLVPLLIWSDSRGEWRTRLRELAPFLAVVGTYALWRFWMLGTFLGGYGFTPHPDDRGNLLLTLPGRVALFMASPSWAHAALVAAMVVAAALLIFRARLAGFMLIAALVLPLYPVVVSLEPRHVGLLWIAGGISLFLVVATRTARRLRSVLTTVLVIAYVGTGQYEFTRRQNELTDLSRELRAFVALPESAVVYKPRNPFATLDAINRLEARTRSAHAARWISHDLGTCGVSPADLVQWTGDAMIPAESLASSRSAEVCRPRYSGLNVHAAFFAEGDSLFWSIDPRSAEYELVLGNGTNSYSIPARGGFILGKDAELMARLALTDGEDPYVSPPFRVVIEDGFSHTESFEGGWFDPFPQKN